ncbi:hypothetical protein V6Z12_D03G208700 [Gossypium hirsutum]
MQDCRQWVNSRMEDRRAEPCEFSQTAPPHKPFDSVSNATFSGSPCNPRIVSFLELLDLPYVLDNASDYRDTPASLPQKDLVKVRLVVNQKIRPKSTILDWVETFLSVIVDFLPDSFGLPFFPSLLPGLLYKLPGLGDLVVKLQSNPIGKP